MRRPRGFTLVEMLTVMLVLSLLALMSYRGLGAVLEARDRVTQETHKWRSVAAFFTRFERDLKLASPRPVRSDAGVAPAWIGNASGGARVEFSRFAAGEGIDVARRVGYRLNDSGEIELWLWPGLDIAPGTEAARYRLLSGVKVLELQYLGATLVWIDAWPPAAADAAIPRAVRLRLVLASGEEIVRVFALAA